MYYQLVRRARTADILSVLEYLGVDAGPNLKLRCPFHDDRTPSMQVYTASNDTFCFSCKRTFDSIDFVRRFRQCGFQSAVEFLIATFETCDPEELDKAVQNGVVPSLQYMLDTVIDVAVMSEAIDQASFLRDAGDLEDNAVQQWVLEMYYSLRYSVATEERLE